eukprot:350364-Chlamydomonas_euryale.AAC.1
MITFCSLCSGAGVGAHPCQSVCPPHTCQHLSAAVSPNTNTKFISTTPTTTTLPPHHTHTSVSLTPRPPPHQVDVPLPFSLLPTSTLEATADAALAVVLPVLRDAFVRNLVARYAPWASAQRAKAARAAAAAADATSAAVATSDGASEHSDANG